ncbi:MAG TPA: sulfatase-like hydrolase/transferase [Candidatus Latescibacteria bacterium]|nr:sulfatase-like hydrolase/transferase [Candidatus Latescibacterota bacterium]
MPRHPNILHLFCDQLRADAIGALGNSVMRTPAIDRLVREGTAFQRAYTPSPVCVSARCSMIYGQYPLHTGCYDNAPMPQDGRTSFMGALTEAGYRTHGIGKCHFIPDRNSLRGFQTRETQEEGVARPEQDDYLVYLRANGFEHLTDPHGVRGEMYYTPQPAQMPARLHPTQWIGDRAAAFLAEPERKKEPWYLFASFIHPHPPFAPPVPWHKLYRAPLMPLPNVPADYEALHLYINRYQNRYKYRDQGIDQNLLRAIKAYYYGAVSFIDYQVGRILAALEETGQLENTLIVFASDHGEYLGDYYCFGKRGMHNAAARVPLIIRHPERFARGAICSRPASLVDIAPTVLAAAGANIKDHELDGVDLSELVSGACSREMVFSQFQKAGQGVYMAVDERWKYFYSAPDGREFLFDHRVDPLETRNRVATPFIKDDAARMRAALVDHLKAGGETAALDGDSWKQYPRLEMPEDPDTGLLIQDSPWGVSKIPGYSD